MNQENIDLAIKNVQSFILQNHRDLSGGEKLTKIVIERIEKSEEYLCPGTPARKATEGK